MAPHLYSVLRSPTQSLMLILSASLSCGSLPPDWVPLVEAGLRSMKALTICMLVATGGSSPLVQVAVLTLAHTDPHGDVASM